MKKSVLSRALCLAVFVCLGCGQTDLNKDLKPVPADAKPPKMAKDGVKSNNPEDKPTPMIKQ